MSKIEINNVYKIFGNSPNSVLPMVKDGAKKDEVLLGLQQLNVGRAAEAGIAIVLLAIVLDRITQSYGETLQERTAPNTKKGK